MEKARKHLKITYCTTGSLLLFLSGRNDSNMLCKLWRDHLKQGDLPRNRAAKIDTVNVHVGIISLFAFSTLGKRTRKWRIPNSRRDFGLVFSCLFHFHQISLINNPFSFTYIASTNIKYQMEGESDKNRRNESDMSSSNVIPKVWRKCDTQDTYNLHSLYKTIADWLLLFHSYTLSYTQELTSLTLASLIERIKLPHTFLSSYTFRYSNAAKNKKTTRRVCGRFFTVHPHLKK